MLAAWRPALVILAVLAAAAWGTALERRVTSPGFPLDDTWIHLQFARNVAEGQGFSFNPGVASSGSSAPLWTLVLALPLVLGLGPIASAKVLGIALVAVTALSASELARRLSGSPWAGLLAGMAVAVTPRMVWAGLSGMEAPLYTALATLAMVAYAGALDNPRADRGLWGLLAGLAGWARPETFVAAAILAAAWFLGGARDGTRRLVPGWWRPLVVLAATMAAFVAFNLYVGGRPLPNTFYAKNYGMGTAVSLAEGRPLDALIDVGPLSLEPAGRLRLVAGLARWPVVWRCAAGHAAARLAGSVRPRPAVDVRCWRSSSSRPSPKAWSRHNRPCSSTTAGMCSICSCSGSSSAPAGSRHSRASRVPVGW